MTEAGAHAASGWSGTWWLSSRWLRRRWAAMIPVLVIVAVGTAGAAIAVSTADRTSRAYGEFVQRAVVGDVVLNPSVSTQLVDDLIRALPGVERVTSDTVLATTMDDGRPRTRAAIEARAVDLFVHGSTDGKFVDMDRPVVRSGRMPAARDEAVITPDAARSLGRSIGDSVPLAFWQPGLSDESGGSLALEFANEVIEPIGVERVEIVGIVTLPGQVLPDELLPRADMIVSPELAADYDCLPATPPRGGTFEEALAILLPADCALTYRYYSLSFTDGAAGVKPALDEFVRRTAPLNEALSDISDLEAVDVDPPSHFLIATERGLEERRVDRSVQPVVAALLVLATATVVVTIALVGLAVARELRRTQTDQQQWRELAVGRTARAMVVGLPGVIAVVLGLLAGIIAAAILAPGAVGQAAVVESGARPALHAPLIATALALGAMAIATVVVLAVRSTGRRATDMSGATTTRLGRSVPAAVGSPSVADGVRAAVGPRTALPVIAGGVLVGGALVAAIVFGSSLAALVSTPASYGWPWDVAAMTGFGYGDLDVDGAHAVLDEDQDVDGWVTFGFLNEIALDDQPMMAMLAVDSTSDLGLPVLEGQLPDGTDEIAIGSSTAEALGLEVGDSAELGGFFPPTPVTVTGIVVFPSLGPFAADRVGAGTGMLLPERLLRDMAEREGFGDPSDLATFVGVELRPDAAPDAVARLSAELAPLDLYGNPAVTYEVPVRPPELVDLTSTRSVAVIVAGVLAVMGTIGLAAASWGSVKSRRRDLAVLRTLGFTGGQIRRSVRVQSVATVVVAVVIGAPLGLVVGRVLWRQFADQLGVVPEPAGPWLPLALVVAGALVAALLAAQLPAILATRERPADGLRTE